jgi:demethylmacrocin O-methyltransferase
LLLSGLQRRVGDYVRGLPPQEKAAWRRVLTRLSRAALNVLGPFRLPLATLATIAGTDKIGAHDYIPAYARFFAPYRNRRLTLLEIGVGGYDHEDGGHSLNMWQAYFRRGTIVAIDLFDKTKLSRGRVHVHQCSQVDRAGLEVIVRLYGGFDLVIDDGSHLNTHQIETFKILFPLMKPSGVYVIEDVQTSYWPAFGGGAVGTPAYAASAMSFFKELVDGVNHAEFLPSAGARPIVFQSCIKSIYFEHNLIVVVKGDNTQPSNIDVAAHAAELESSASPSAGFLER